jgi:hypothetical protein
MQSHEFTACMAQITALEARLAQPAAALRALGTARPSPVRPLRPERAALWRIAMVCKDALRNRALPLAARPYFVQIAEVCRAVAQRKEEGQGGSAGV